MTSISSIKPADALATAKANASKGALDQRAFLKLMTTQLKTQDPFNPVDNTQMVAQMAQFSSVAGIAEMNASLTTIKEALSASRVGDAASWIGRSALVASDVATPLSDGSYSGELELADRATDVTLSLVDASGRVVHSEAFGARAAGPVAFTWNGKNADGTPAAGGPLTISVTARGAEGALPVSTSSWAAIGGVQSPAGGATTKLITPLGLIAPDAALKLG
jgi:flagellar basal-body rod modification protein FlgD